MQQFILMGFKQDIGFRVFTFEVIAADKARTEYTVKADLALSQKHGIRLQELPLLCRGLLERSGEDEQKRPMTFTEEEMRLHSRTCTAARNAAIQKRKAPRRPTPPPSDAAVNGWRRATADGKPSPAQLGQLHRGV